MDCCSTTQQPRREDIKQFFRPLGAQQATKKKRRPLPEVIKELGDDVVKAVSRLQPDLPSATGSAELPASVNPLLEAADDPVLIDLKERQRKRMSETATEERRPTAKAKAGKRQTKRGLDLSSSSLEQPAAKKKEARLSAESFAACAVLPRALDVPEAASPSSAALAAQQLRRKSG